MSVEVIKTGSVVNGKEVIKYILCTENGDMSVSLLSYGAVIQSIIYKGVDCALGFDTVEGYVNNNSCQGAIIGRYANRMKDGRFTLNGKVYQLGLNSGGINHAHGGFIGFDKKVWDGCVNEGKNPSVTFSYRSVDGEEGYPGNLDVEVTYSIVNENEFTIEYTGLSDADTPLNLTNHVYFNLNTSHIKDVLDTELTVYADRIPDTDEAQVCNGKVIEISGTPLDFTTAKTIGRDIESDIPVMKCACGHDHSYILGFDRNRKKAATAYSPESGITLECFTDMPAVGLYTANYLNESDGKNGINLFKRQGFCLETQFIPNSVNIPEFPCSVIKAGEKFYSKTTFIFTKK